MASLRVIPREALERLRDKGFSVENVGDVLYIKASNGDVVLADLPKEFLEEVLRSGFNEIVLVAANRYYYYRRDDIEKLVKLVQQKR